MEGAWPSYPETVSELDQGIEDGKWPRVWCRKILEVPEVKAELWLRLAQEVWRTAEFKTETVPQGPAKDQPDGNGTLGAAIDVADDEAGVLSENTSVQIEENNKAGSTHAGQTEVMDEEEQKSNYYPDVVIARRLMGYVDSTEYKEKLTPEQQDNFEQSTFSAIRQPEDSQTTDRDARLIYIRLIQKGREHNLWDLCVPSYPVIISRPTPRNQTDNLDRLFEAREVRTALLSAIRDSPVWLAEHRVGLILLSAMLWDGLLEEAAIDALAHSIDRPLVRGASGYWLDLLLEPNKPARTRIRRFWPQALTTMLWLRHEGALRPECSAATLVGNLLKQLLGRNPPSLSRLLKGIAQEIALDIPELLVHVATGATLTHPVKTGRWHAIQGIGHPGSDVPVLVDARNAVDLPVTGQHLAESSGEKHRDEPLLELVNPSGMAGLRKAMREDSVSEMIKALEWVLQEQDVQPPIVNHLARWLKKPSNRARASTRSWMFGLVGARLVSLCGEDDPGMYDDDELGHLYAQVIEDGKTTSLRQGMRYALTSFHRYLSKGDPIQRPTLLNELERSEVSARVITHDEYIHALDMLGRPGPTDDDPQWLQACQIALILFFRLGMRRRELLWLPLHDIHGEHIIEILIRPFNKRALKTINALRTLMLNGFLSESEFAMVQSWLMRRRNEATVKTERYYFFTLTHSKREIISEARIIERIVEVLRTVTGDQDIHIHHLRHSFATWTVLSLVGTVVEDDFEGWSHLPNTQQWLHSFPAVIKNYSMREAPQRNLVYLISVLMGHSTPAITLEHYIHCTDYLLSRALSVGLALEPGDIGAHGVGLPSRTYYRWSESGWSGVLNVLAKRAPARWTDGEKKRTSKIRTSVQTTASLYQRFYINWQALKWVAQHGVLGLTSQLARDVDADELAQLRARVNLLEQQGLLIKPYPEFPHGSRRESITQTYTRLFENAIKQPVGNEAVKTICELFLSHKVKGRGALRFREPETARKYVDCLLTLGIPWSQINFTWVGSRFTERESKDYRTYWRNALSLSRRITIGTQSTHNNRPLSKTKGYMDIRVMDMHGDAADNDQKSSLSYQWVVIMTILHLDTLQTWA
ncbi:MAG: tyrosine-type recombinase/integrase [Anaerolineae bacterium]|jgi:site-specific recombinase XerD|nr:tyrosine-type recombinase/integrase [Anaerolineae bacterium]